MQTQSSKSPPTSGDELPPYRKAFWGVEEEAMLIHFFSERISEITNGKMFKPPVFRDVAKHLETYPNRRGPAKNSSSCQTKFKRVCISFVHVLSHILTFMTS
jgi:hypothetical protein